MAAKDGFLAISKSFKGIAYALLAFGAIESIVQSVRFSQVVLDGGAQAILAGAVCYFVAWIVREFAK